MNFRDLHLNVKIRLFDQFLRSFAFNMLTPFMIFYFAKHFGQAFSGLILMVNLVLAFIMGLYGGHLADKWGRKIILQWGGAIRLIIMMIMAISASSWFHSPIIVLGMVTLNSMCIGFIRPAGAAMIADASQPEQRKYIYTIDYWLYNISAMIGGVLGGFFFRSYFFELISLSALIAAISLVLIVFVIDDTYIPRKSVSRVNNHLLKEVITNYRTVLKDSVFKVFILAYLLCLAVQTQTNDYVAVRLPQEMEAQTLFRIGDFPLHVDGMNMYGILYALNSVFLILLGWFAVKTLKNISQKSLLLSGILVYTVGFTIMAISNQPGILIISQVLIVTGELMFIPARQVLMVDIIPSENRGAYMATQEFGILGAMMLGSFAVTLGAFLPSWMMGTLFFLCGISSMCLYYSIYCKIVMKQNLRKAS